MLYEDCTGKIYTPEEFEALPLWVVESLHISVFGDEDDENHA